MIETVCKCCIPLYFVIIGNITPCQIQDRWRLIILLGDNMVMRGCEPHVWKLQSHLHTLDCDVTLLLAMVFVLLFCRLKSNIHNWSDHVSKNTCALLTLLTSLGSNWLRNIYKAKEMYMKHVQKYSIKYCFYILFQVLIGKFFKSSYNF